MSGVDPDLRPTRLSGASAIVLALVVLGILSTPAIVPLLGLEIVGIVSLVLGGIARYRARTTFGWGLVVLGFGIVLGAAVLVWSMTEDLLAVIQFVPGMLGTAIVAAGVIPIRRGGSRHLVKLGTGLLFLTVLAASIVQRPSLALLSGCGVLVVLSWDAGENAIGLGSQIGRRAHSYRAEGVHVMGTALVGLVAIGAGQIAVRLGSPGVPLGAFAVLIIGLILLAGALHG